MNIFIWLFIGHLVGDWLLQNEWMANGKKQQLFAAAGMAHFAIYTIAIMGTLWFADVRNRHLVFYVAMGTLIFVSHWLIDATNLVDLWMRFYGQSNLPMVRVMVDQTLHILVLVEVDPFVKTHTK